MACFHIAGNTPVETDRLNKCDTDGVITGAQSRRTRFVISGSAVDHHQECPILLGKFSRMRNYQISKTATAGPGADSVLVDHHVRSRAQSQRPALLQAAAETTATSGSTGKEDLKADRRVRHYKEVGLQEWPPAGRATIPRVLYGISLCMSLRRRTILSKSLRAPAPVDLAIHVFRTVDRTAGRRFAVVAQFWKR